MRLPLAAPLPSAHDLRTLARGRVLFCWILPTLACNLRCRHCRSWEQPGGELELEFLARNVLPAASLAGATFILEGGEFFLYSQHEQLLDLLDGRPVVLFSNASLPELVLRAVRRHKLRRLILSLDGPPERNEELRSGSDLGALEKLLASARGLTEVVLNQTLSSRSRPADLHFVERFAREHGVRVEHNVYSQVSYLGAPFPEAPLGVQEGLQPFAALYDRWLAGKVSLPCTSVRYVTTIYPDGSVRLCKKRPEAVLGNVRERRFDLIWNAPRARELRRAAWTCNGCWLRCQRGFDLGLSRYGGWLPQTLLRRVLG
ncbi:MAG: hypothetical protein A2284_18635 [Deltaproteobacteria bacterium RIFOXYA12_FULL_61_11]|nr:MAG: hypothetical protein A2284_18635 [Deltaproteobacteria bacterium RIFOXYA12_FULL_61_11]